MKSILMIISIIGWIGLLISLYLYRKLKKVKENLLDSTLIEKKGPKVVVIGGGTGQSIFLRGLKHYSYSNCCR